MNGSVARPDLERSLLAIAWPEDERDGLFGPRSAAWQVFRERALVTYAPRAVMLQYAHPAFAAASASYAASDSTPGERFERAVGTLLRMIFGDRKTVLVQARRLHLLHGKLDGTLSEGSAALPAGSRYHGNDRASLAFVLMTLLDASVRAFERFVSPIDRSLERALFEDVVKFAALFGLSREEIPSSRPALGAYVDDHVARVLVVGEEARAMWRFLGSAPRKRDVLPRAVLSEWAAFTLPGELREALGVGLSRRRERVLDRLSRAVPARLVPARARFVDAYAARVLTGASAARARR
jgi:uncharacterized protein (DUF2236 family)